jgi:chromate transporter
MVDGLGLAETTPGPLILVLQFVGFAAAYRHAGMASPLLAGSLGAALTLWTTFVPCFFWIFLGAPYIEQLRQNKALAAALGAITAAVVGVIMNLALWFALHVVFGKVASVGWGVEVPVLSSLDWRAALLSAAAMVAMFRLKLGMLPTLAASALAGLALLTL